MPSASIASDLACQLFCPCAGILHQEKIVAEKWLNITNDALEPFRHLPDAVKAIATKHGQPSKGEGPHSPCDMHAWVFWTSLKATQLGMLCHVAGGPPTTSSAPSSQSAFYRPTSTAGDT